MTLVDGPERISMWDQIVPLASVIPEGEWRVVPGARL